MEEAGFDMCHVDAHG